MRVFNDENLASLFVDANISPRKRAHYNLHASYDDKVQRILIALTNGSYVTPHYHEFSHQWEMFVVIRGLIRVCHYNSDGAIQSELLVGDGQSAKVIEFNPHDIHSVECLSDIALMLEIKEGPYDPDYSKKMLG